MYKKKLIPAVEFCTNHHIDTSFISSLQKTGLIEIITIKEKGYIHESKLRELERIVRFYYELDINLEGIETINYLLNRNNELQDEIIALRNRLRLFEDI
jgi:hypothetical protein